MAKTIKKVERFSYLSLEKSVADIADHFDGVVSALVNIRPDLIIGIGRGGLLPATLLSYKMSIPLGVISIQTYNDKRGTDTLKINTNVCTTLPIESIKSVLIVDDIADSGETLGIARAEMMKKFPNVQTATIHYKKKSIIKPDYFYKEVPNNTWIEYPWAETQ